MFYNGKAITVEQQIHKAKELGFDGLAIETKRPIASPLDLTKADRARIKSVAANEGIELVAIESLSNFCGNLMEERENNLWPGIINDDMPAIYGPYTKRKKFI